ncbi:MAG TPA: sialidase family protein [Bradyrhizobium sp.]|uniref:sialidase family protein n=1 Tax=Bradyrhizobium sp. TaxID=376 RepID=UPI002D810C29|nr:sialidase family protein [Bradyrhizobium sp.]HET7885100.1 sialidase family protein [Bradyrhizobium sp.]
MSHRTFIVMLAAAFTQGSAFAQMSHNHGSEASCATVELRCASKVTPAFSQDGTLWLAWMAGGQVSVARSSDEGRSFSSPVQVTQGTPNLDWGPDARPKIALDRRGGVAIAFSTFRDKAFNGEVFYSRSTDGGKTFAPPRPITGNAESQRFEAVGFDGEGNVFAAWLDKRNRVPVQQAGKKYDGAALFFASSRDGGETYTEAAMAVDNTCECCRLGLAFDPVGHPVIAFRNIFDGGIRDHAVVTFTDSKTPGEARRVSEDDWQIAACPHQGPSLSISPDGTYHVVWYTKGKVRKGLFYARSRDGGRTFSQPMPVGEPARNPSRPYVMVGPQGTQIVWKEFDGEKTSINLISSTDAGMTWSRPRVIATTADASDHPLLVSDGRRSYLSWMTKADGYRLQPIEGGS